MWEAIAIIAAAAIAAASANQQGNRADAAQRRAAGDAEKNKPPVLQDFKTPEQFRRNRTQGAAPGTLLTGPSGVGSLNVGKTLLGA